MSTDNKFHSSKTIDKFSRNAIFNVGGTIVSILCYVAIIPFVVSILGKAKFGIWALANIFISFGQFSNLGFDRALVKFVAEFWAQGKSEDINKIASTVFIFHTIIASLIISILFPLRNFLITELFRIPQQLQAETFFVLTGIIIIFFFKLIFSTFRSVLLGLQRMDITNTIFAVSRILSVAGIFFFLSQGFGLKGLVINSAIIAFLVISADIFWVRKIIKDFRIRIFLFSKSHLRRIFKFGLNIFSASVASISIEPVNKIILTNFVSLGHVTFYEVGTKIQSLALRLFGAALTPLLPASSELESYNSMPSIEKLYLATCRAILFITFPIFILLVILAVPFVKVWLGSGYEPAGRAIQFLLIGYFASLFITPAYIISRGIGKPQLSTAVSISIGLLNLIGSIFLGIIIGYYGVLLSVSLSLILGSILMIYLFYRTTKFSFPRFLSNIPLAAMATTAILAIPIFWLSSNIDSWSFMKLIAVSALFMLTYVILVLKLGFVNQQDKRMLGLCIEAILRRR